MNITTTKTYSAPSVSISKRIYQTTKTYSETALVIVRTPVRARVKAVALGHWRNGTWQGLEVLRFTDIRKIGSCAIFLVGK